MSVTPFASARLLSFLLDLAVDPGRGGTQAGKDGGTARSADGGLAVCVGEQNSALRQRIDVGSDRIGMTALTTDPVVEIVDRDEQDVELALPARVEVMGLLK